MKKRKKKKGRNEIYLSIVPMSIVTITAGDGLIMIIMFSRHNLRILLHTIKS